MVISVDYDEFHPETYRAIELHAKNGLYARVTSGNFERDLQTVHGIAFAIARITKEEVFFSSSVDNFRTDSQQPPKTATKVWSKKLS